jgi:retinol dehydrogenase-12
MSGRVSLVTGATSGIGKAAAEGLAKLGATVVVVGRNDEKCATTVEQIRWTTGSSSIEYLLADLSSQSEVRRLAQEFEAKYSSPDVLINNAGTIMLSRRYSVDDIEMTFALNHLAYFLLTNLLTDRLMVSPAARVVNVSSVAHKGAQIDFDDLQGRRRYNGLRAYGRSKLANLLFTYELARRLKGTSVTANALHPGLVATNLLANNGRIGALLKVLLGLRGTSPQKGARTVVYLASSPDVMGMTGQHYVGQKAVQSSRASYDTAAARRLWEASAELTTLSAYPGQG